jgi:hypothetical protein
MADEADLAQHQCDIFLQASIMRHQNSLKQCGDIESEICVGCDYMTKSNFGKQCEAWRECLQDHESRSRKR